MPIDLDDENNFCVNAHVPATMSVMPSGMLLGQGRRRTIAMASTAATPKHEVGGERGLE